MKMETDDRQCQTEDSRTKFVRAVLGDITDFSQLGYCDAHEHIAMNSRWIEERYPSFIRKDVEGILPDLKAFRDHGGGWIVDCSPPGSGRDVSAIVKASRMSGLPIVAATGMHLRQYYPPDHPMLSMNRDELAQLFIDEIKVGMKDGSEKSSYRAGVIKIASGRDVLDPLETEVFAAAGIAQAQTGCPIITHTEGGEECQKQIDALLEYGAEASQITLSHCDKVSDIQFQRDLLQRGVCLEYDQHFRQLRKEQLCVTVEFIAELSEEFPDQIVFGMDFARNSYWSGLGGEPGLVWLVTELPKLLRERGVSEVNCSRLLSKNAVEAFSFLNATHLEE